MSRRKTIKKRTISPDPVYESVLVSRFINRMMRHGKKGISEKVFYQSMKLIKEKMSSENLEGVHVFEKAVENVKPQVEVKSRRVGGAVYQVPIEVQEFRQVTLAIRWLVTNTRKRSEKTVVHKLSGELMDAYKNTGNSIKKKEEIFKTAESNKAFAHYRW